MFDRISIRSKLIAIVAAPLAVIIALAAVGFVQRRADATATRADVRRLEVIDAAQLLQHELQRETLYSVIYLASDGQRAARELTQQRRRTDEAVTGLERSVADFPEDEEGAQSARATLRQMEFSGGTLRAQVDAEGLDWQWALELFNGIEASLPLVGEGMVAAIKDTQLAGGAQSVVSLGDYGSWQARTGILLAGAVEDGGFPDSSTGFDGKARFDDAVENGAVQLAIVRSEAAPTTRVQLRSHMSGGDSAFYAEQVEALYEADAEAVDTLTIPPDRWARAVVATLVELREIATTDAAAGLVQARDRLAAAEDAARLYLAGALLAVLLAVGLAIAVATSIVRPVRRLTTATDRVASEQLPKLVEAMRNPAAEDMEQLRQGMEALEVGGGPELARLTRSVNAIQEVAVDVATEQATLLRKGIGDMFVNLARRNQGLLDRQLAYIDDLEAQEEDPDQLEHLFKLDHMATRMRRNAESLLVLAGAEPNRRRGQAVPLTKVTMAAVGEIEHFPRVELLDVDEAQVASQAAADIAHLLSELMENATQFSPPDTRVEVVGHRGAEGYTISITDHGIGMSEQQLADANELLARPPLLGLTLARTLGFIVVSRLAARHEITVRLVPSPNGGVTAIVILPASVLAAAPAPLPEPEPDPLPAGFIPSPSSILPPLEMGAPFATGELDDAPATLADAVPTGPAFTTGLDQVVAEEAAVLPLAPRRAPATGPPPAPPAVPTGPVAHVAVPAAPTAPGALPTRRGTPVNGNRPVPPPAPTPPLAPVVPAAPMRPAPVGAPEPLLLEGSGPPGALVGAEGRTPAPPLPTGGARLFGPSTGNGTHGRAPVPPAAPTSMPTTTAAGLVRRVPRRAGATRAVPGGDGGRGGATTSTRSPDEVRSMLSRFHSGRQAGQASPSGPASSPGGPTPPPPIADEKDT